MTGVKESNYDRRYLTLSYMTTILKRDSYLDVFAQHVSFSFLFCNFKQTILYKNGQTRPSMTGFKVKTFIFSTTVAILKNGGHLDLLMNKI